MDQCEDPHSSVRGDQKNQNKAQSYEPESEPEPQPEPEPEPQPAPSCVSLKSDRSKEDAVNFKNQEEPPAAKRRKLEEQNSPEPESASVSTKTGCTNIRKRHRSLDQENDQQSSEVPRPQQHSSGISQVERYNDLHSIFMRLEDNLVTFVKKELKKVKKVLSPECSESQREDEEELDDDQRSSREKFQQITVLFLRRMKQEKLADCLQISKRIKD